MSCLTWIPGRSWIHRVTPEARLFSALVLMVALTIAEGPWAAMGGGVLAVVLVGLARLPLRLLGHVLIRLNLVLGFMALLLLPALCGSSLVESPAVRPSGNGFSLLGRMVWKGNAMVMLYLALLATMDPMALGLAMRALRLPSRLALLYLLTVRYVDLLHHEWERIRRAMGVRGFRARADRRTFRLYGHALGRLFLRSLERAERIVWAMKCRGFKGHYPLSSRGRWTTDSILFAVGSCLAAVLIFALAWIR